MKLRNNLLAILLSFTLALDIGLHVYPVFSPNVQAQTNTPPALSLNAVTTGTGTAISATTAVQVGWTIIWSAGVGAGEVTIEAANTATYAGTWAVLDVQNFTAAPAANSTVMGTYPGPFQFVRARVTSNVTGGTTTVYITRLIGH